MAKKKKPKTMSYLRVSSKDQDNEKFKHDIRAYANRMDFGKVEFDDEANIFYGEVINLRDVVTFQGETVNKLRKAFRDSIDDYLEFCATRGEEPEKPYSGKFVVRVEPELHKTISIQAKKNGKSLNAWIQATLSKVIKETTQHSN